MTGARTRMTVELNGVRVQMDAGATVREAVARAGAEPERRGIAVAVDGEVVPRSEWASTLLREGQRIEVVGAIQGG